MNKIIDFEINKEQIEENRIKEIEELCINKMPLNIEEVDLLLKNLSYLVRKKIADHEDTTIDDYSYSFKCDLAQSMIYHYLNNLNIKVNPVNTNEMIKDVTGHSLIVANINTTEGEKIYLVDPTYIQFFTKEGCDKSKFVILKDKVCITPDPGYFISESNSEETVMPLLTDGYIELTDEVAKAYGDSFFQTKVGVTPNQMQYDVATGSSYIRWFQHFTSRISKSEEELSDMNLLIISDSKKSTKHK